MATKATNTPLSPSMDARIAERAITSAWATAYLSTAKTLCVDLGTGEVNVWVSEAVRQNMGPCLISSSGIRYNQTSVGPFLLAATCDKLFNSQKGFRAFFAGLLGGRAQYYSDKSRFAIQF